MQIAVADLKGVYPAIITPMLANDELDFPHLNQLVEDLIAADVAGICVCRTTGHAPVLTLDEHVRLAVHVRDRIRNRCALLNIGSMSPRSATTFRFSTSGFPVNRAMRKWLLQSTVCRRLQLKTASDRR